MLRSSSRHSLVGGIDGRRLARRAVIGVAAVLALAHVGLFASGNNYAPDFHHGLFPAAQDILRGRSPYPRADPASLFRVENSFVMPPVIAVLAAPFTLLPYGLAILLWNALAVCAFGAAMRMLGVRDPRFYILAFASIPLIDSIEMGQPDALFALALAVAWRYRDHLAGPVALAALIAAKLLAAPLLVWLLVTRRWRAFGVALTSTAALLLGSWALIGFKGLAGYPHLLAMDARAFEAWDKSGSLTGGMMHLGLGESAARIVALALAAGVALVIVRASNMRDFNWFVAMLVFGLLASPIMWAHYLVALMVPLAITRRPGIGIWIPTAGLWFATIATRGEGGAVRAAILVSAVVATALSAVREAHRHPVDVRPRLGNHARRASAAS